MDENYALGIVGMGVMGRALSQNFLRNGYPPIAYDIAPNLPADLPIKLSHSLEELVRLLRPPRTIILMLPAGAPVDSVISTLKPLLNKHDLVIDAGNSHYTDTEKRQEEFEQLGLYYIGMGISGGENGAAWGPSIMPGGSIEAWPRVQLMFETVAAKTKDGEPCVTWIGPGGSGHYVKMVHNGIEYGDMQLIAEAYDLLHRGAGISNQELVEVFTRWNSRELHSYLIEITAKILARIDDETGRSLVDMIVDEAEQKGTGKWASQAAMDTSVATPTINAAVESRLLSALKSERNHASKIFGRVGKYIGDKKRLIGVAESALYASKITSYAQGLNLLRHASQEYGWHLNLSEVVSIWRSGCIIRASILSDISNAFQRNPDLPNLLLDETFRHAIMERDAIWREAIQIAVSLGIPMLATSASLAYFDAYRSEVLPANLIQAQRDFFGAHTYRRVDRQGYFHTNWES